MKTINNVRWLEVSQYQRRRRHRPGYTIAGILLSLALWALIGVSLASLLAWP